MADHLASELSNFLNRATLGHLNLFNQIADPNIMQIPP
jgi:hypothetical protein